MAYRQNDSQGRNDRVRFDLMEHIGVLSRKDNGWTREVNIVAWNDGPGKVDIREWDPDHKRMTRGVTLFEDEAETLTKILARRYNLFRSTGGQNRQYPDNRQRNAFMNDSDGSGNADANQNSYTGNPAEEIPGAAMMAVAETVPTDSPEAALA